MKVIIADQNRQVIEALKDYDPTFEWHDGTPLAFDIDAVVSPANTAGIMNGGYDAALRRHFGNTLEYRVRKSIEAKPIPVGEARAIQTADERVKWLIVAPTVSIVADGLSGHETVSYAAAYRSVITAHRAGAVCLGMTGLGTGAGGLEIRKAIFQQCDGIEDALVDIEEAM